MTTTSTFKGMEGERASSRVLKPPGGGSSNIFGGSDPPAAAAAQKPRNKPADSGVFNAASNSAQNAAAQRSARDGDHSFQHLFGDNIPQLASPSGGKRCLGGSQRVNTHLNLFGGTPEPAGIVSSSKAVGAAGTTHSHIFGDGAAVSQGVGFTGRYSHRRRDGNQLVQSSSYNPITGSEYKDLAPNHHALNVKEVPKAQKEQPPLPCSDSEFQAKEGKMQNVQTSTRVTNPPGGKTHKLW